MVGSAEGAQPAAVLALTSHHKSISSSHQALEDGQLLAHLEKMEEAGPSGASAAQSQQALVLAGSSETADILPQLQNIVATVNLGVKLDLKGVALHARNAEYNPKVIGLHCDLLFNALKWQSVSEPSVLSFSRPTPRQTEGHVPVLAEVFCSDYAHPRPKDHSPHLCVWQSGEP